MRLTPAFTKSYGVASSRHYSLDAVKRWWPVVVIVIVLVLVGAGAAVYVDWTWKRKLSPRGGRPFLTHVELPVPSFQQGDDKWRDDSLGGVPENGTIGGEGCAVASAAMVFKFYGIDVDPQQLNWFLTATGGYTDQGWLYWDRAAWFAPDRVRHVYEDLPSYQLIDSNLAHGNPVIVRVRLGSGITHFVVIAGKDGFDYLVRDPGRRFCERALPVTRTRQRHRGAAILPAHRQCEFAVVRASLTRTRMTVALIGDAQSKSGAAAPHSKTLTDIYAALLACVSECAGAPAFCKIGTLKVAN